MDSQYIDSLMLNVDDGTYIKARTLVKQGRCDDEEIARKLNIGKTSIAALRNRLHYMGAIT